MLQTLVAQRVAVISPLTRIGGFSTKTGLFKFGESDISRTLYLGEIRGYWLPVRFEISAPLNRSGAVDRLIFTGLLRLNEVSKFGPLGKASIATTD